MAVTKIKQLISITCLFLVRKETHKITRFWCCFQNFQCSNNKFFYEFCQIFVYYRDTNIPNEWNILMPFFCFQLFYGYCTTHKSQSNSVNVVILNAAIANISCQTAYFVILILIFWFIIFLSLDCTVFEV